MLVSEIGNICYEEGGVGINKFARIVSLVMLFEQSEENKWATSKGQEIDLLISKIGKFCCGDGGGVLLVLLFKQSEENEWVTSKGRETDLLASEVDNICCEDGGVGTNKSG